MRPGPGGSGWLGVIPGEGETEPGGPHFAPIIPGSQDRGTGLTAVAIQEANSDVVEVRLGEGAGVLQVLLNQEVLSFAEQSWMDLKGEWDSAGPIWDPGRKGRGAAGWSQGVRADSQPCPHWTLVWELPSGPGRSEPPPGMGE